MGADGARVAVIETLHPEREERMRRRIEQERAGLRRPYVRIADYIRPFASFVYWCFWAASALAVLGPILLIAYLMA